MRLRCAASMRRDATGAAVEGARTECRDERAVFVAADVYLDRAFILSGLEGGGDEGVAEQRRQFCGRMIVGS